MAQRLHKGPLRCELRIASTRLLSLADTRFLTAVLFVSIHIVKQYKPPHSRTQTRNVLVLPFTAVAKLGCVLLKAFALTNTCFTRMPNARLSQNCADYCTLSALMCCNRRVPQLPLVTNAPHPLSYYLQLLAFACS